MQNICLAEQLFAWELSLTLVFDIEESELEDIDEALSGIDEAAVDMDAIEGIDADEVVEAADLVAAEVDNGGSVSEFSAGAPDEGGVEIETVQAAQVGSIRTVETKVKSKRHWRPRSFALDFAPGEAVSVTRRLYLSGESEYQLNGRTCRLRDITDLFAGTGLSGAHYAIIEQGRIGQILSAKPADRRNLIEEAAGISKFRSRQRGCAGFCVQGAPGIPCPRRVPEGQRAFGVQSADPDPGQLRYCDPARGRAPGAAR